VIKNFIKQCRGSGNGRIRFSDPRPRIKLNHWLVYPFFADGVSEEIVESETQDRRSRPRRLKRISDVHISSDPFNFLCRYTRRGAGPGFYGSGRF